MKTQWAFEITYENTATTTNTANQNGLTGTPLQATPPPKIVVASSFEDAVAVATSLASGVFGVVGLTKVASAGQVVVADTFFTADQSTGLKNAFVNGAKGASTETGGTHVQ
jgi:hypothetical protein